MRLYRYGNETAGRRRRLATPGLSCYLGICRLRISSAGVRNAQEIPRPICLFAGQLIESPLRRRDADVANLRSPRQAKGFRLEEAHHHWRQEVARNECTHWVCSLCSCGRTERATLQQRTPVQSRFADTPPYPRTLRSAAPQLPWPTFARDLIAVPELLRGLQPAAKLVVRTPCAARLHNDLLAALAPLPLPTKDQAPEPPPIALSQVILRDPVERAASQYRNDCSDCEHAWKPLRAECACPISAEAFEAVVNATAPVLEARLNHPLVQGKAARKL